MNKLIKLSAAAIIALAASSALASEASYRSKSVAGGKTEKAVASAVSKSSSKFYLKGLVGYNFGHSAKAGDAKAKAKTSTKLGLGAGFEVAENLRTELMLNYLPSTEYKEKGANSGIKLSVFNPMLNAHYDLGNYSGVTPFVSAGLGFSKVNSKAFKAKYSFAYMAGAGVGYEITQDVIAEVSYAYTNYGSAKVKGTNTKVKLHGNSVNLALRVKL